MAKVTLTLGQYEELDSARKRAGTTLKLSIPRIAKMTCYSEEAVRELFREAAMTSNAGALPPAELRSRHEKKFVDAIRRALRLEVA